MIPPPEAVSLSVIIPTYNRADFLPACIASLQQSGATGLEILVVDDGSTDDTPAIMTGLGKNVRYVRQTNAGPAAARNNGFGLSHGRYVAFVDSDDEWLPGRAAGLVELLDRHPEVDVLFTEARMGNREQGFESWIEVAGQRAFADLPDRRSESGLRVLERRPLFHRMAERNMVFISCTVLRREAFATVGGFDASLCGAADWHLWLRLASRATFAYRAEPLGVYTRHTACMSNDQEGMKREFCLTLQKLLVDSGLGGAADRAWIKSRLRHHLFGYAYHAYERGDSSQARMRFAALLRQTGLEFSGTAYWALCALPFGLGGRLRRLKQRLGANSVVGAGPTAGLAIAEKE